MYRMKPQNHNKGLFYHPSPRQLRGGSLIDDSGVNYGIDTTTNKLKASSDFVEQHKAALSDIDMEMPTLKSGSKKDRDLYRNQMAIYNKKVKDKEKGFHKQYKSEIMGNLDEQFLQAGYTKDKSGKWRKPASLASVPWMDKAIGWIPGATDFANRAISAGEKVYNKPNLENILNAGQTLADSAMSGYNMGKQLADPKKLIKDIAIQQGKKLVGMGLPKDYNKIDNHYNGYKKRKIQGKGMIGRGDDDEKKTDEWDLKGFFKHEKKTGHQIFVVQDEAELSNEEIKDILEKSLKIVENYKSYEMSDSDKKEQIEILNERINKIDNPKPKYKRNIHIEENDGNDENDEEVKKEAELKALEDELINKSKKENIDFVKNELERLYNNDFNKSDLEKVQKYIKSDIVYTAGKGYEQLNATRINDNSKDKIIIYSDIKKNVDGAINDNFDDKYKYRFYGSGDPEQYFVDAIELYKDGKQILNEDKHFLHFDLKDPNSHAIIQNTKFESAKGFDNLFLNTKTGKLEILDGLNKPINIIKIDKQTNNSNKADSIPINNISEYYINISDKNGVEYVADMLEVAKEVCELIDLGNGYKNFVVKNEYKLNTLMPIEPPKTASLEERKKYINDLAYFNNKYSHNLKKDPIGLLSFIFPKKYLKLRYNKK